MAIIPRKNKKNIVFEESSTEISSNLETSEKKHQSKSSKDLLSNKGKSYNEMTIEVLEILEKKGIDIYDKNRMPGMYLKGNEKLREQILLKKLSDDNNEFEDFREDNSSNTVNNLLNFFKK